MDISEMIQESLDKLEKERKQEAIKKSLPVYNCVCLQCGKVIAVDSDHPLYERCENKKNAGYLDAAHFDPEYDSAPGHKCNIWGRRERLITRQLFRED